MFTPSGKSGFDKALEKATSQLLLEPDWDATLQICDCIRQKDVSVKYFINAIRKKLFDKNPRVTLYALQVLESCVKNCGSGIHEEIACKQVMDDMKELTRSGNDAVKNKALEMIQAWAHAFRNEPTLKIVNDTFNQLKGEGNSFPPLRESDAMFMAEKAPEWVDGDKCHTCRVEFGVVQRKHHCRHCGQLFCSKCSSKQLPIPKFGIEKPVRVCEPCYTKLTSRTETTAAPGTDSDLPQEYLNSPLAQQSQAPPQRNERELQEEEELQLAMALSLDAAENKHIIHKEKGNSHSSAGSSPPPAPSSAPTLDVEGDPELARYLNRPYWEQKQEDIVKTVSTVTPSAPANAPEPVPSATAPPISQSVPAQPLYSTSKVQEYSQNGEVPDDIDFVRSLSTNVDVFINRMKSDSSRGRSIASDTAVQSLFHTLTLMHPQLLNLLQDKEDKRAKMESLQDKLAQIQDAREALDALREDHREKKRREAEEAERQRQIQLAQKLEIMRQKKQEYLHMQQQLAQQRLHEHARELEMRREQQKQQHQMRQIQYTAYAQGGMAPPQGVIMGQPQQGMIQQQQPGMVAPPQGTMMPPGQYAPPPQTFSPSSSMQGSPAHSGYSQQQQQSYPVQPPPMEQQAPMQTPSTTPQPGYTQGYHQQQQQQPPSYQQAAPQPPQTGAGYPMGYHQQQPPSTQPHPGGPPNGNFSPLSSMDYPQQQQPQQQANNPYNMQGLASTLPPPAQQYGAPAPQGVMYQQQPGVEMQYGGQTQQQQQQQQQPPQQPEASLISFD
ncbi:hepatocyte growth factor-regulated tyrosine kinase substrate-like isoform X1 [Asterias amurensis]|uniref:hepatocyte growth factor-regulated tyrosine kinase substrate-like isoform X1 n=1 Tax=Asterias amurensis TaxID=7602 RepID=UPI003AB1115C